MDKILIIKNKNEIVISNNGKRLVVDKNNSLFEELKEKTKEEIKNWYLNRN